MKSKLLTLLILIAIMSHKSMGQITEYAIHTVPSYNNKFTLGTNPGFPQNHEWLDQDMADLCVGIPSLGIAGFGANSFRVPIPDKFIERYDLTIRRDAFDHYEEIGMFDLTVFLEDPSDEHRDTYTYNGVRSKMFRNMYEPIWDGGANGTPVNDNNYMALYVYNVAMEYGDHVRFWEIWNEPDLTNGPGGQEPGTTDNWWDRDPRPDELLNLNAPVFHYIRALRICYEVLKYVDSNDFVCIGGVGYKSFVDAVLRNTDNPTDGSNTGTYPRTGGAYFDCLSFHSYPMYSMRKWNNNIKGWDYMRHSDKGIEAVIDAKKGFEKVLNDRGFNGTQYPKKVFIITETNIPRIPVEEYIGSDEAQRNYLMKMIVTAKKMDLKSLHTFSLYDGKVASQVTSPYNAMGFYDNLDNVTPYNQKEHISAAGCKTIMQMIGNRNYSSSRTAAMNLPDGVEGAAFSTGASTYIYVLWAKTTLDKNEYAKKTYTFPAGWNISEYNTFSWNYSRTGDKGYSASSTINLTGVPIVVKVDDVEVITGLNEIDDLESPESSDNIDVYPNPATSGYIKLKNPLNLSVQSVQAIDLNGKVIDLAMNKNVSDRIPVSLSPGIYILQVNTQNRIFRKKLFIK